METLDRKRKWASLEAHSAGANMTSTQYNESRGRTEKQLNLYIHEMISDFIRRGLELSGKVFTLHV